MEGLNYGIKTFPLLFLFCLVVTVPSYAGQGSLVYNNGSYRGENPFNRIGWENTLLVYNNGTNTTLFGIVGGLNAASNYINISKSEDGGNTWVFVLNFATDTNSYSASIDNANLIHIYYNGADLFHRNFSVSENTLGNANVVTALSSYFLDDLVRRNGTLLLRDGRLDDIYKSEDNGSTWGIVINGILTEIKGQEFSWTETPDQIIHTLTINGTSLEYRNYTGSNYIPSGSLKIILAKTLEKVSMVSDNSGNIYSIFTEKISNSNNVIWFSSMSTITKAFSNPVIIANYSDINVTTTDLILDKNTNNLYIMLENDTNKNVENSNNTNCGIIESQDLGLSWGVKKNISDDKCFHGFYTGKNIWLNDGLDSSKKALIEFIYFNGTTKNGVYTSGLEIRYSNFSIPFSSSDIVTGKVLGTDTVDTYFDFETQTVSSSNFSGTDFRYNAPTNILYQYVPAAPYNTEFDNTNTLLNVDCRYAATYRNDPLDYGINIPQGTYDIICFNLSALHGGLDTYGAIKVINNTNVRAGLNPEFDFWYAYYPPVNVSNPTSVQFTNFGYSPNPPRINTSLTVSWLTSAPISTYLYFAQILNGNQSAFFKIAGNTTPKTSHTLTIPNNLIFPDGFVLIPSGNNSAFAQNEFNGTPVTIFVNPLLVNTTFTQPNATVPVALDRLADTGFCDPTTCVYIFGFIILMMVSLAGFIFGGMNLGVASFVTMLFALSVVGWLPTFLVIPVIVIAALIVISLLRKPIIGGGE